jgi:hypothetical protein
MFTETLFGNAKKNLAVLGDSKILKDAYLAGGTAVALQLGHRISIDLDFFTPLDFIPKRFAKELSRVGDFREEQASKGTVIGKFRGIKFSLFTYKYPLLYPSKNILGIKIADLRDIAAMKIDAIATRGAKRDFIDLYFIAQELPLKNLLRFYDRKFWKLASNLTHIHKSLVYFKDAETETMPQMLKKADWLEVKRFFEREVKKLTHQLLK